MAIHYPELLDYVSPVQSWTWTDRDFIHYALCLGMGCGPTDPRSLPFVYEGMLAGLKIVPTMPTVVAWEAAPTVATFGANPVTVLLGEQAIELHAPIPCPVTVNVRGRVVAVHDKGKERGALVITEHQISDKHAGTLLATLTTGHFARTEGGCGSSQSLISKPHAVPTRAPDYSLDFPTRDDAAFLYRLTGDRNPLHADPQFAALAGFPRPILHGLCSFGITCRAILVTCAEYDPSLIACHQARFSSPVFPGETLTVDLWRDAEVVSFEARVKSRNVTVIKNGRSLLRRP
jgi:acyl dehydratase